MSNTDIILDYLDDIHPVSACDDCISSEAEVQPRQTVNQICNRLSSTGIVERRQGVCAICQRQKLVNLLGHPPITPPDEGVTEPGVDHIDVEQARTEVVRICNSLWRSAKSIPPPRGISRLLNLVLKMERS